jgi:hypothetical protein
MSLGFPAEVLKAIRKRLLVKFLPDAGPKEMQGYQQAIDAAEDDVTPGEKQRAELTSMAEKDKGPVDA